MVYQADWDSADGGVVGFRTMRGGIARTVGLLIELTSKDSIEEWEGERAQAAADRVRLPAPTTSVAHGKVAILKHGAMDAHSAAAVFQSSRGRCGRADCGNAAAAIAYATARHTGSTIARLSLHGSVSKATAVTATVAGNLVSQTWRVSAAPKLVRTSIGGLRAVELAGLFNNYVVVDSSSGETNIDTLLAGGDPLARVAAVGFSGGEEITASFYTCGRRHPSAPLTGLAVLAYLASRVDWLAPLIASRTVTVNGVPEPLPSISERAGAGAVEIELPTTWVTLESLPDAACGQGGAA